MPQSSDENMEWKVKRRKDGSRYIVRRPIRNQTKRYDEKADITTTTEDETFTEIKTGRYWNKMDRKKHIEKSKDKKCQRLNEHIDRNRKVKNSHLPNIKSHCNNIVESTNYAPISKNKKNVKHRPSDEIPVSNGECGNQPTELFSVTTV